MDTSNPIIFIALVIGVALQLAIIIAFFMLCTHVAKLLKAVETISSQLFEIKGALKNLLEK